jgi:thiamine-phosphate pyrophosphorylase
MHNKSLKFFCYVDNFDNKLINNLPKNTSVIYRNYEESPNIETILKIKKACNNKGFKFFLSNNIKLAIQLKLDGAYIPSFNKQINFNSYSLKKKFELLGSAHNLKEIRIKEAQKIKYIFLSPLFSSKKNKNYLGIYKFLNLMKKTKKEVVCLGGITKSNIKSVKNLNLYGMASISYFKY